MGDRAPAEPGRARHQEREACEPLPIAHEAHVVGTVTPDCRLLRDLAGAGLVNAQRETFAQQHADGDPLAGCRIVVSGGIAHEEEAAVGNCARSLLELGRTERSHHEFGIADRGDGRPRRRLVGSSGDAWSRWTGEHREQQQAGPDWCLIPLVTATERDPDVVATLGLQAPVTGEAVSTPRPFGRGKPAPGPDAGVEPIRPDDDRSTHDIAAGLRRICREDDCVARMGEGFVLALGSFTARDLLEKRRQIESILAELAPADAGARPLVPRIGAAYYPEDGAYAEDLLATADLRLNEARRGRPRDRE